MTNQNWWATQVNLNFRIIRTISQWSQIRAGSLEPPTISNLSKKQRTRWLDRAVTIRKSKCPDLRTLVQQIGREGLTDSDEPQERQKTPQCYHKFKRTKMGAWDSEPPQHMINTTIADQTTCKGKKATNICNNSNLRCTRKRSPKLYWTNLETKIKWGPSFHRIKILKKKWPICYSWAKSLQVSLLAGLQVKLR